QVITLCATGAERLRKCFRACCALKNHSEFAVRLSDNCRQSPHGYAFRLANLSNGFAVFIEDLPGQRTALFPARSFGPDQNRFAARVRRNGRMLALACRRWRRNWF